MALIIDHNIPVNASPESVWAVINDIAKYSEWNPFVVGCDSTMKPGDPIVMKVCVIPGFPMKQVEKVFENEPGEVLSYGIGLPFGMLSSYRSHRVVPTGDGCCEYQSHFELKGWLSGLVKLMTGRNLRKGFTGMSEGIARRTESLA